MVLSDMCGNQLKVVLLTFLVHTFMQFPVAFEAVLHHTPMDTCLHTPVTHLGTEVAPRYALFDTGGASQ